MQKKTPRRAFYLLYALVPYSLFANPHGCDPRSGTATLSHQDQNTLTIHTSDKAIIHWDNFSIAEGETTRFVMPSATSAVLNRVVGNNLSEIYGVLEANGKVFLINSKGIIFGEHAQINTASFFASTLDALDADFLKGNEISFIGNSQASIVNLGTITAWDGDVVLIAYQIDNKGVIEASNGVVALAAGTDILLAPESNKRVLIRACSLEKETAAVGINNQGTIKGLQAELIADGNPYQFAIKDGGQIDALAIQRHGGNVYLVAEGGQVEATGQYIATHPEGQGGNVHLLGKEVYVDGNAEINTSGMLGGGTVLIGGDYQGENPNIPNAEVTFVGEKVHIYADALENGDGGKVILWGNRATGLYGNISTTGGSLGGNGGFIEVSSPGFLDFQGFVNTSAPCGKMGMLFLDPCTVTISASSTNPSSLTCPSYTFATNSANIFAGTVSGLAGCLASTNATIDARLGTTSNSSGTVTFNSSVVWDAPTTLTVIAPRSIIVSALVNAGMGSINFTGEGITDTTSEIGNGILINASGTLMTSSGNITLSGTGCQNIAPPSASNSNGIKILGTVQTDTGTITMNGSTLLGWGENGIIIDGGTVKSTGSGSINLTGTANSPSIGIFVYPGSGVLTTNGGHILNSSGSITMTGNSTAVVGNSVPSTNNAGVAWNGGQLTNGTGTTTITGNIDTFGIGSGTSGILVTSNSHIDSGTNLMTMEGTNQAKATNAMGITISGNSVLTSSTEGPLSLTGHVTQATGSSAGIFLTDCVGSGTVGNFTMIGTNSSSSGSNQNGVHITGANGIISGLVGTFHIEGTGGGSGTSNHGILLDAGGQIQAGTTLIGTGGGGTDSTQGILVTGTNSLIYPNVYTQFTMTGTGGGSGTNADGISFLSGGQLPAQVPVTLSGTASPTGTVGNAGIRVDGTSSSISTEQIGFITITATGHGTGNNNNGLSVTSGGTISVFDTSVFGHFKRDITITATGATAGDNSYGILIDGTDSAITANLLNSTASINLNGTALSSGANSQGIHLSNGGSVTQTGSKAVSINLTGVGSTTGTSFSNEGIFMTDTSTNVSTPIGNITLTGTAGNGTTNAITIENSATVSSSSSGDISLSGSNGVVTVQNNSSISTLGTGHISVTSQGVNVLAGLLGSASMTTSNGNIMINSTGPLTVSGGSITGSAQITVGSASNTMTINSAGINMMGGGASGAFAEISTVGGLLTIDGVGAIGLTGGSSTNTQAQIITKTNAITGSAIQIGQTTPPTSISLQGGSGGTLSRAVIASDVGGTISSSISGGYTITGGTTNTATTDDGRAGFYPGLSSGSGNAILTGANFVLTGGSGIGNNVAQIVGPTAGGFISMNSTSGSTSTLQGGSGSQSAAQIKTQGAGDINFSFLANGPLSLLGSTTSGGTNALASITTANGDIGISSSGLLTLQGGTQAGTLSQITVGNQNNAVNIASAGINMMGGGASGAYAEISTIGGTITIDGSGPIGLTGGSSTNTQAQIITKTNAITGSAIQIGQTTPPTSISLQGGSGDTLSRAVIASDVGGTISSSISGGYTITGGTTNTATTDDGRAGFYPGLSSGSGNATLTGANFVLTGGSGIGNNVAQIVGPTAGGFISMNSTSGSTSTLQGGSGSQSAAQIKTQGAGDINFSFLANGPLSLLGSTTSGGTNALASITTANGDIGISSSGLLTLQGGTQAGTLSQITVGNQSNAVNIASAGINMMGGGASGAYAEISTIGGTITIDGSGPIGLTGGSSTNTQAQIITKTNTITGTAIQIGHTTPPTSITLQGGSGGTLSRAVIASDVGGTISSSISGGYTITGGTTNTATTDNGRAGFYAGLSSGGGNISLAGTTYTLTGGASGQGKNLAEIATLNTGGNITIIGSGDFTLSGGNGANSNAAVTATLGTIEGAIGFHIGDYILSGGNGDLAQAYFSGANGIQLTGRNFTLTPHGSGSSTTGSNTFIETTRPNTALVLRASNAITLDSTLAPSIAQSSTIRTNSAGGINPITIFCRSLDLKGGSINNNFAEIFNNQGQIRIFALGNVTLTGGSAGAANATIESKIQGSIVLAAHKLVVTGGSGGTLTGIQTASGNIGVACTGDCVYTAPNASNFAVMRTLGSDLDLAAAGSIDLSGYTKISTPAEGNLLLIAGVDISIGDNTQVIANGTTDASSLTLVVDENYPTPSSGIGPGQFILDSSAILTTGAPGSDAVPVRIFTAMQDQNSINAQINGQSYVAGTEFVDSSTERWGIYYPSSIYDGASFMLFYKNTNIQPTPPPVNTLSANTIARILYQAAFVDSELFYDLSLMDGYEFDDTFHFSTFEVWLERYPQPSQPISYRDGLTCNNDQLLAGNFLENMCNSQIHFSPGFGSPYHLKQAGEFKKWEAISQQYEKSSPKTHTNRRKVLTSYKVVDDKGLSIRRRKWQNRHDLIH